MLKRTNEYVMTTENRDCAEQPTESQTPCCPGAGSAEPAAAASCCPPPADANAACCPEKPGDVPGFRIWPFVCGWQKTPVGEVPQVKSTLERCDILGRWQMRWGLGRMRYTIAPGLYAIGTPGPGAPVLVSANYKLSFDALRSALGGIDAWILVIDTKGINVWCAAGKGTFGTEEIVHRVNLARLDELVAHRTLVVPQLGAPGVAAHKVKKGCGFKVIYGPVRASDLPAFLKLGMKARPYMRRVTFTTKERLVLTPVELTGMWKISLWVMLALMVLGGIGENVFSLSAVFSRGGPAIAVYLSGLLAGAVLTPTLLPWIPGRAFAAKGALTGAVLALPLLFGLGESLGPFSCAALALALPAVASYCAMNFTGSTSYTSPSGVEKEMRLAIPLQGAAVVIGGIAWLWGAF